jgi:hypothetical protein
LTIGTRWPPWKISKPIFFDDTGLLPWMDREWSFRIPIPLFLTNKWSLLPPPPQPEHPDKEWWIGTALTATNMVRPKKK